MIDEQDKILRILDQENQGKSPVGLNLLIENNKDMQDKIMQL